MLRLMFTVLLLVSCSAPSSGVVDACNEDALRDSVPPIVVKVVQDQPVDWASVPSCAVSAVIAELRTGRPLGGKISLPDRAVEYRVAQVERAVLQTR